MRAGEGKRGYWDGGGQGMGLGGGGLVVMEDPQWGDVYLLGW